jgi:hypothetical protein
LFYDILVSYVVLMDIELWKMKIRQLTRTVKFFNAQSCFITVVDGTALGPVYAVIVLKKWAEWYGGAASPPASSAREGIERTY